MSMNSELIIIDKETLVKIIKKEYVKKFSEWLDENLLASDIEFLIENGVDEDETKDKNGQ
jgi:hypothetical protein